MATSKDKRTRLLKEKREEERKISPRSKSNFQWGKEGFRRSHIQKWYLPKGSFCLTYTALSLNRYGAHQNIVPTWYNLNKYVDLICDFFFKFYLCCVWFSYIFGFSDVKVIFLEIWFIFMDTRLKVENMMSILWYRHEKLQYRVDILWYQFNLNCITC